MGSSYLWNQDPNDPDAFIQHLEEVLADYRYEPPRPSRLRWIAGGALLAAACLFLLVRTQFQAPDGAQGPAAPAVAAETDQRSDPLEDTLELGMPDLPAGSEMLASEAGAATEGEGALEQTQLDEIAEAEGLEVTTEDPAQSESAGSTTPFAGE